MICEVAPRRLSCVAGAALFPEVNASDFFDFPDSIPFASHFDGAVEPWRWIREISLALASVRSTPPRDLPDGVRITGAVHIDASVELPAFCSITGPAWIGPGVEIRPGAYIRGNVIVGGGSILGNSCEFKNALLMEGVQTSHYNYVGDSILGSRAHLGAGVILSNLRLDQHNVRIRVGSGLLDTGLRKFGAIIGEAAEVGCNAVLNPGSMLGKASVVGPLVCFSGSLGAKEMILNQTPTRRRKRL